MTHSRWEGVLYTADGKRVLPTVAEFDAALVDTDTLGKRRINDSITAVTRADCNPLSDNLYFLPTREWADALAAWIRARCHHRVLEVGAGDGFVAHLLRERDVDIVAMDNRSWNTRTLYPPVVETEANGAVRLARKLAPDLILWVWAPLNGAAAGDALLAYCREYLLVGESRDGCTGGFPSDDVQPVKCASLDVLDAVARCRTDYAGIYGRHHTAHALYRGTRFEELPKESEVDIPNRAAAPQR